MEVICRKRNLVGCALWPDAMLHSTSLFLEVLLKASAVGSLHSLALTHRLGSNFPHVALPRSVRLDILSRDAEQVDSGWDSLVQILGLGEE